MHGTGRQEDYFAGMIIAVGRRLGTVSLASEDKAVKPSITKTSTRTKDSMVGKAMKSSTIPKTSKTKDRTFNDANLQDSRRKGKRPDRPSRTKEATKPAAKREGYSYG
jgi:hypothetical protein